jgi:thioesterase III
MPQGGEAKGGVPLETVLEIPVRSTEVDFLGHVNNAKYLEYMEWGREDWYRKGGSSFEKLNSQQVGTATVNININYHQECGLGDILLLKTRPVKTGRSSFVLQQELFKKETGKRVSDAQVTTVVIDLKTRKSMPIPPDLLKLLE